MQILANSGDHEVCAVLPGLCRSCNTALGWHSVTRRRARAGERLNIEHRTSNIEVKRGVEDSLFTRRIRGREIAMSLDEIAPEALRLPATERALLAESLWESAINFRILPHDARRQSFQI